MNNLTKTFISLLALTGSASGLGAELELGTELELYTELELGTEVQNSTPTRVDCYHYISSSDVPSVYIRTN
jgi:hypothetical protein